MSEQDAEHEFRQHCDTLVQRGFVRAYLYDNRTKSANFEFTPAGEQLRSHLRRLFDVPANHPKHLAPDIICSLIMVVMLTPPPIEVI